MMDDPQPWPSKTPSPAGPLPGDPGVPWQPPAEPVPDDEPDALPGDPDVEYE
jgi:hypothetical protein